MKLFRPTIVLLGSLTVMAGFLMRLLTPVEFMTFVTATVFFWFKSRDKEKL